MDKKQPVKIGFRLQNIEIKNFSFSESENNKFEIEDICFEFSTGIKPDKEEETILTIFNAKIFNNQNKEIQLCDMTIHFKFHVKGLSDKFSSELRKITLPTDFLATLFSITYSTARGILFDKCAGTYLSKAILPIIDPAKLVPKRKQIKEKK